MIVHTLAQMLAATMDLTARGGGFLQTLRHAVIGFLVIVWLIGLIMGFVLGRLTGRVRR